MKVMMPAAALCLLDFNVPLRGRDDGVTALAEGLPYLLVLFVVDAVDVPVGFV